MANRYWVGGRGTWTSTSHWSTTSGGSSGASVPTATDDVYFNSSSGFGAGYAYVSMVNDVTINSFNVAMSVTTRPIFWKSDAGAQLTITAATVSLAYVDFQDIKGSGAAAPFTGTSIGDGGNCSGITFTAPTTRYWIGNAGSWEDPTHWSETSGGTAGTAIPLPQDNCIFDENSFTLTEQLITIENWYILYCTDIDFRDVTNNPIFGDGSGSQRGSLYLSENMTLQQSERFGWSYYFDLRDGDAYLLSAGHKITALIIYGAGNNSGKLVLSDDLLITKYGVNIYSADFDANGHNVTLGILGLDDSVGISIYGDSNYCPGGLCNFNMGSGTWYMYDNSSLAFYDGTTVLGSNANIVSETTVDGMDLYSDVSVTINNFTYTGHPEQHDQLYISGTLGWTFNNFTLNGSDYEVYIDDPGITVSGTFSANGLPGAQIYIEGDNSSDSIITAASTSLSYLYVSYLGAAGVAVPFDARTGCDYGTDIIADQWLFEFPGTTISSSTVTYSTISSSISSSISLSVSVSTSSSTRSISSSSSSISTSTTMLMDSVGPNPHKTRSSTETSPKPMKIIR